MILDISTQSLDCSAISAFSANICKDLTVRREGSKNANRQSV